MTIQRYPQIPAQPQGRGPNGRRLCRLCGTEVPKGRQSWCSNACVEAYRATDPVIARVHVWRRDRGVCWRCGVDTAAQRDAYAAWLAQRISAEGITGDRHGVVPWGGWHRARWYRLPWTIRREAEAWLDFHGIPLGRAHADFWDADHIVPVAEGGGGCTAENLRTLCIRCHKRRTAAWHAERARVRRAGGRHAS